MILGILGGIGSGKSTVTDMFAALGADTLDADAIGLGVELNFDQLKTFEGTGSHV